jgi:hypothetical protein
MNILKAGAKLVGNAATATVNTVASITHLDALKVDVDFDTHIPGSVVWGEGLVIQQVVQQLRGTHQHDLSSPPIFDGERVLCAYSNVGALSKTPLPLAEQWSNCAVLT